MTRTLGAAMLVFAALPHVAAAACGRGPTAGEIGFEPAAAAAPLMVVQGKIGDAAASIVLDTGASAPYRVFIGPSLAQRLTLALSDEITPPTDTAVGGERQTYRTARLPSFTLGPISLTDVEIAVVPMIDRMGAQIGRPVDAIVGHQLLRDRIVAIDYAARRVSLDAKPGEADAAIRFELARQKPLVLAVMTINGRGPFVMEIDTGATGTSLSPRAAARAGVKSLGHGQMAGAGGRIAVGVGRARASLGGVTRDLNAVAITPAIDSIAAAAGSAIDGVIGGDFFAGACLTLDFPQQRLWLSAP